MGRPQSMEHLYVHIPFCRSRCAYCDFASESIGAHARAGRVERYLEKLREEIDERAGAPGGFGAPTDAGRLETIYMGGGTPTALPGDALVELVQVLGARLTGAGDGEVTGAAPVPSPEFTMEANPGTMDAALLERLSDAGVTRLSLGVQSFAPALRAALGRRVTQGEIEGALGAIRTSGWREWNLDLVFGIPGQTWELAVADIDAAVAAGPSHVSLYDLTYTPAFAARVDAGDRRGMRAAGGRRAAAAAFAEEHYAAAVARLEAAGYRRYEVSNFALPGHECRHNLAYWRGEDYVGAGASAVSTVGLERRTNPGSVAGYLAGEPPMIEVLTPSIRLWERAMLGLRTRDGVEEKTVAPVLDAAARDRLLAQGCVERCCGKLRLNPGFLDVSNAVIGALLVRPEGL